MVLDAATLEPEAVDDSDVRDGDIRARHRRDRDKTRRAPIRTGSRLPHRRDRDTGTGTQGQKGAGRWVW